MPQRILSIPINGFLPHLLPREGINAKVKIGTDKNV